MCLGSVRGEAVDVHRLGKSAVDKDDQVGDICREVVAGDA